MKNSTSFYFGFELLKSRRPRSAVMPYTITKTKSGETKLWLLNGIHYKSGEITDFGGGIKKHEVDLSGAYRELMEETKGVFGGSIKLNDLTTCISVAQEHVSIIESRQDVKTFTGMSVTFVPVDNSWLELAPQLFLETSIEGSAYNEISELIWIEMSQFSRLCLGDRLEITEGSESVMWPRLRIFYSTIDMKVLNELLHNRYFQLGSVSPINSPREHHVIITTTNETYITTLAS